MNQFISEPDYRMQIGEDYVNAYIDLLRTRIYTIVVWWFAIALACGAVFACLHERFGVSMLAYGATTLPLCMLCVHLLVRQHQRRLNTSDDSRMGSDDNPSS
ncbi:hypothetical protein RBSWK_04029 [Rhodopirellula baltica SWK14]|uniref:Uncharacterized protein n=1 Tax=Rhodopirellula baltica SWK14 TaxID=993516 RepID=L7CG47_RHOBT|nr:hypothetical protein RBSWK_04029 [Rhodopirellula baltica SWK14]